LPRKKCRVVGEIQAARDVREDLGNIALQYELVAESIEQGDKKRRVRKPRRWATRQGQPRLAAYALSCDTVGGLVRDSR
jgi:hypothetical protein